MNSLPFSLPVNVRRLPKKGQRHRLEVTDAVKEHLIKEFGVVDVLALECEASVAPWKKDGVRIEGSVQATLLQPCAVTGEEIETVIDEPVEVIFVPQGSKLALPKLDERGEIVLDVEGDDLPETFEGDSIDLVDVWMEFFGLGYNPFARKEGVELDTTTNEALDQHEKVSPFAALAALKKH